MQRATVFALIAVGVLAQMGAAQPATSADHSLSVSEYMDRGLPAIDRAWSWQDYDAAAVTLGRLNPDEFPRTSTGASAPVVERLTNPENTRPCSDRAFPLNARITFCGQMIGSTNAVILLYLQAASKDRSLLDDASRMFGLEIQVTKAATSVVDEFVAALNKNDPTYPEQIAVVEKLRADSARVIHGSLIMLGDDRSFSDSARVGLATTIAACFPDIAKQLPPLSKIEFENKLRRFAQADSSPGVRAALADYADLEP